MQLNEEIKRSVAILTIKIYDEAWVNDKITVKKKNLVNFQV